MATNLQEQQRKPHNCDELGDTYSEKVIRAERLLTEFESLELTSTAVDGETHSKEETTLQQEETTVEPGKTREQRVAISKREIEQNRVKVAKLRGDGILYYRYIPMRSLWMRMCSETWGATHEETATLVSSRPYLFVIEICGTDLGCGVILRDIIRYPIVALSRVFDDYVSQFYFELQGVSLGLKLAMKYKISHFEMICTSNGIAQYVMLTLRNKCLCPPPRDDDTKNPQKKKYYCLECSRTRLDYMVNGNTDKITRLMDEIFYDALECKDYVTFNMRATELSSVKAVCHLANSGMDQELRLPDIEEDEKLAEILYKEVYGHVSNKEEMVLQQQQLMLKTQQREMEDIYNKEVYSYYESKRLQKQGQELQKQGQGCRK